MSKSSNYVERVHWKPFLSLSFCERNFLIPSPCAHKNILLPTLNIFPNIVYIFLSFSCTAFSISCDHISNKVKNKWQMTNESRDSLEVWAESMTEPDLACTRVSAIFASQLWKVGRLWLQEIDIVLMCHRLTHDFNLRIRARTILWKCFVICLWPNFRLTNGIDNKRHLLTWV